MSIAAWRKRTVTVPTGAAAHSEVVPLKDNGVTRLKNLTFSNVDTAFTGTITVYVAPTYTDGMLNSDSSFIPLTSGGSNVTLTAGKAVLVDPGMAEALILPQGGTFSG